jgi:hypothetical protein
MIMSRWKSVVTNVGLNLLSNVTDSKAINIVAVKCGTGKVSENSLENQTNISGYKCDLQIVSSAQTSDTNYRVTARLANDNVADSFNLTQVGVFATLGDSQNQVLFMIIQCSDEGDVIPASSLSKGFTATYQINLAFSNTENVNITVVPIVEGLATVATSGSYNDLRDKPELANVATSGSYEDLTDVPELAVVATSGDYNNLDHKPYAVCNTVADINKVLSNLKDTGGKIYLLPGNYDFSSYDLSIDYDNIVIEGSGTSTIIKLGSSSEVKILGNDVSIKNLTILREDESSKEAVLLDSDGTHKANRFELSGVNVDCVNTTAQLVKVTSSAVGYAKFLNCVLTSGGSAFIQPSNTETITGIVNGCMATSSLTVPQYMTLGVVVNITQISTASEG